MLMDIDSLLHNSIIIVYAVRAPESLWSQDLSLELEQKF